ncbi:MAG: hypothetical protein IRZ00_04695 [Gemmatimonadetes bacterium]|nr:hypothetical protein [Gemmatimonadota bacterium]
MIVIVAAAAVAAVFYPLVTGRGSAAPGDLDPPEYGTGSQHPEPSLEAPRPADPAPTAGVPASAPGDASSARPSPAVSDAPAATAVEAAADPGAPVVAAPRDAPRNRAAVDDELEAEVLRYREALRAGTVCDYCRQANPPGSRFCFECGQPLEMPTRRASTPET